MIEFIENTFNKLAIIDLIILKGNSTELHMEVSLLVSPVTTPQHHGHLSLNFVVEEKVSAN